MSHGCELPHCTLERHGDQARCILHLEDQTKDPALFEEVLQERIREQGHEFNQVFFPEVYRITADIGSRVRFLKCRFPKGLEADKRVFGAQVSMEYCVFEGPVSLQHCHFEQDLLCIGNTFHSSLSWYGTGFHGNTYFGFDDFRQGANFYRTNFLAEKRFVFRNCRMGYSLFHNTDIDHMEFILCEWHRSYVLAEEQYDFRIETAFGAMGIPDTYIHRFLSRLHSHLGRSDLIPRTFFPRQYRRQKRIRQEEGALYLVHGGWNDLLMAEDTYRKLRLTYSRQGEPEIAGEFFYRERVARRRQRKPFRRIWEYCTQEVLFGYGERPLNVLLNSGLVIFLFTLIYSRSEALYHGASRSFDFLSALYFSVVTFTTLGYGDYHPESWLRFLAAFEALLGAVFIALLIVTLSRKLIR